MPRLTPSSSISPKGTLAYSFLMIQWWQPYTRRVFHSWWTSTLRQSLLTTPGADGISVKLLKQLSINHLQSLLLTFNVSFNYGILPSSWKHATIVPICKPGKSPQSPHSYLPIALTSASCKAFERMLCHRLFFCQRNLFPQVHYGFIPTRDCTLTLSVEIVYLWSIISSTTSLLLDLANNSSLRYAWIPKLLMTQSTPTS